MLMPDNQRIYSPKFPKSESWSIENFNTNDSEPKRVIRRFINSAIYVEKPITHIMPPLRKKSPIYLHGTSENEYITTIHKPDITGKAKVILRSYTSPKLTDSNDNYPDVKNQEHTQKTPSTSSITNSGSDKESQITVKTNNQISRLEPDMRISLTSLSTQRTGQIDFKEKEEVINNWLKRKSNEKKKKEIEEIKMKQAKEKERTLILEQERENFRKWLAEKRAKEEIKKKLKEREEQERQLQEAEKEKRRVENELCFNMWLRRKKRVEIERKINQKLTLLQLFEEKQKRLEENEKAFREWVKGSKNKPKPLAPNQGLKSLCSSTSVTYVNPIPWHPNVELMQKPASQ